MRSYLVLETGEVYSGDAWRGGASQVGEVVFNTSHSGYEEVATDPSYYNQIVVMTSVMQGNYGASDEVWESEKIHIKAFVCLEIQNSYRESSWLSRLLANQIPVVSGVDTRRLVLRLRDGGTPWGAVVKATTVLTAREEGFRLINEKRNQILEKGMDWPFLVSCTQARDLVGDNPKGPRVAVVDFGVKKNILRELKKRCSQVGVFPCRSSAEEIKAWSPDGILLSNGPGDPHYVEISVDVLRELLGWRPMMGICMGHQLLCRALGAQTYKLKFGHRGSNHPVKDELLNGIYMTAQNHGYAVDPASLPKDVRVTHVNLNDGTVSGIFYSEKKCLGVQFHPESHPGPRDAESLFDYYIGMLL